MKGTSQGTDFLKGTAIYAVCAFLMVFFVLPLISLFVKAFQNADGTFAGLEQFRRYLSSPSMLESIGNTFYVAIISTVISMTAAFAYSYILARKNIPFKTFFRYVGMLPLLAPTMLLGISLIYLFGNQGIFTGMGFRIPLYGSLGIIIAESIYCFPVATTILTVAFSAADNRLYEAAEAMGTSSLRKMLTITIPNVKYGLISAAFVCFTYGFTDFGAPSVIGGNYNVLPTDVYKQVVGQQNFNMGAVVGIVLLFPAVLSFLVDRLVSRRQNAAIGAKAVPYRIRKDWRSDVPALIFCGIIAGVMILFFLVSLFASLIKFWPYDLSLSLSNYDFTRVASGEGMRAFGNSLTIALIVAALGTTITFLDAYLTEKCLAAPRGRKLAYFLSIAPLAIPGTVVGLSFILFFNASRFPIPFTDYAVENPLHGMYGTIWIIVAADLIHYYSVPFSTATTALKRLDREFETVSESMGASLITMLRRVVIPLSLPAIFEMAVYYFVNAMITVSAVVFLYSPTVKIAAVAIVSMNDAGDVAPAAAMCMVILLINLTVRLIYEGVNGRLTRKSHAWMNQ